jgi:hypothetical protein
MAEASGGKHLESVQKSLDSVEKHIKEAVNAASDAKLKEKLNAALQALHVAQM